MPKSFLFTHKRYDYDQEVEQNLVLMSPLKTKLQPPPLLRLPDVDVMVISNPRTNGGSGNWSFTEPKQNKSKFEKITRRYAERYHAEINSNNKVNSGYCIKIPVPVPPLVSSTEKFTERNWSWFTPPTEKCSGTPTLPFQRFQRTEYFNNGLESPRKDDGVELELDDEQPVNLSVRKVDLFNLNCLAEVSLATAEAEGILQSSPSSKSVCSSSSWSSCSSTSPNYSSSTKESLNSLSHPKQKGVTLLRQNSDEDYEMGELRICESPLQIPPPLKSSPLKLDIKMETVSESSTGKNTGTKTKAIRRNLFLETHSKPEQDFPVSVSKDQHQKQKKRKSTAKVDLSISMSHPNDSTIPASNCTSPGSTSENGISSGGGSGGRHKCQECGKGFSTLSNLARHRQTHRSLSDSSAVKKCPHCDKVYVSMPAFSMHLRTHNQGCKCPYCGKGFSRPWLLQGHIRTHTGEKPFSCSICEKAFADKSNLRAHTQTHSSEKPFICKRCGKPFALKSYLCKHIESSCMKTSRSPSSTNSTKSSADSNDFGESSCSSFSGSVEDSF